MEYNLNPEEFHDKFIDIDSENRTISKIVNLYYIIGSDELEILTNQTIRIFIF